MLRDTTLIPRDILRRAGRLPAWGLMRHITPGSGDSIARVIHKALLAMAQADQPKYQTPTGNVKVKPGYRCQTERARLDTLLDVLADWPGHPMGSTTSAVEETLRRHLYANDEDPWSTAEHSLRHSIHRKATQF